MSYPFASAPHGVLSDATLDHLIRIHAALPHRALSQDEARLMLTATSPALHELRNSRQKLALIAGMSEPDNVVAFPLFAGRDQGEVLTPVALDRLIAIFAVIRGRMLSDADGALILTATGPALAELRQTRRKLAMIADLSEADNVTLFTGVAA